MSKSYVTIEENQCPICGSLHQPGLLMEMFIDPEGNGPGWLHIQPGRIEQ